MRVAVGGAVAPVGLTGVLTGEQAVIAFVLQLLSSKAALTDRQHETCKPPGAVFERHFEPQEQDNR